MTRIIYGTDDGQFYASEITDADIEEFPHWQPIEISDALFAMWEEARVAYAKATRIFERECWVAHSEQHPDTSDEPLFKPKSAPLQPHQIVREADPELERLLAEEP